MAFQGIRTSCQKIAPVGSMSKPDWSKQSTKSFKVRAKTFRDQIVLTDQGIPILDQQKKPLRCNVRMAKAVRVTEYGKVKEYYEGMYNNIKVRRVGYSPANVYRGRTPGKWVPIGG